MNQKYLKELIAANSERLVAMLDELKAEAEQLSPDETVAMNKLREAAAVSAKVFLQTEGGPA